MEERSIFYNFLLFLMVLLSCESQTIKRIFFKPGTNMLTNEEKQRDGLVLVQLDTNEITTICNFKFDDKSAGIVCKTLGFPDKGLSITDNTKRQEGPVLLANFQCTGQEANISYCPNSGRNVLAGPCSTHTMDVHVFCLEQALPPLVKPNDVNTYCNLTNTVYTLVKQAGKLNIGLLLAKSGGQDYFVCNDDYALDFNAARILCNQLCTNSSNPSIVMPSPGVNSTTFNSVKLSCSATACTPSTVTTCFAKSNFIGLRCGDEPQTTEKPPRIACMNQNMTVIWDQGFLPFINSSLVELSPSCNYSTKDSSSGALNIFIPFNNCSQTIQGDASFVYFSYVIKRSYLPNGLVTIPAKDLVVTCSFPKNSNPNNTFQFATVSPNPIIGNMTLDVQMKFYTDNSYLTELVPPNAFVSADKQLFVKVYIINPPKNVSLTLLDCSASITNVTGDMNNINSILLIKNVCPNSTYDVVISPFNRSEIRFQFTPFKITSADDQSLYISCKTLSCYLNKDSNCRYCESSRRRRKRSINIIEKESMIKGVLYTRAAIERF